MTEAEARTELERRLAIDIEPTLSADDITSLLATARCPDAEDRVPSDEDWTPTWDLDYAAAAGWEMKAGRASGSFNFAEDGQQFSRIQIFNSCMEMAKLYRRGAGTVRVGRSV